MGTATAAAPWVGKSDSMSSVSTVPSTVHTVKTTSTMVTSSQHRALHGDGQQHGTPGTSRTTSRAPSTASDAPSSVPKSKKSGASTAASTPRMPSRASSTASSQGDRRVMSRQSSTASAAGGSQVQALSRQLSVSSSAAAASNGNMARNHAPGFPRSNTAGSNASRLENEQGALMNRSMTGGSVGSQKPVSAVQVGMEWDENQQEWVMRARETKYPVGKPDDDLMAMIAQGEVDLSEEARGVGPAGSRRPSVMRLNSANSSASQSFNNVAGVTADPRPQPDSKRILVPKLIHGAGRPSIIFSPYGSNWALDVLVLAHNGVRKELQDCYEILSYYELNWENAFSDEVSRFFAWWEIFQAFVLRYFDAEEQLLFPWITEAGGFLSDSLLEANRLDRKKKMSRLLSGIGRSQKSFLRDDMRSELVTSLKFSVDRLTIMLMEYFGEEEIVLPPVIAGIYSLADKRAFDKKWADFFTTGPGGGLDCIQLSRWQVGAENRDAVKFGIKNEKAVQEWRYDNLNNIKWASYAMWEKKYVGKQLATIQYFRDKRKKLEEGSFGPMGTFDRTRTERAVHWNSEVQSIAFTPRSNSTGSALNTPRGSQAGSQLGAPPGSFAPTPRSHAVATPRSQASFGRHASDPLGGVAPARSGGNSRAVSNAAGSVAPSSRAASQAGRSSRAPSNVSTASQKMRAVPAERLPYKPVEGGFDPRMRFDEVLDTDSIASEREDSTVSSASASGKRGGGAAASAPAPGGRSQAAAPAPVVVSRPPPGGTAPRPAPTPAPAQKGARAGPPPAGMGARASSAKSASVASSRNASSVVSGSSRTASSVSGTRQVSSTFSQVDFDDIY